ncbi:MAG: hypothetical protein OHK0029_13860 [Armatimonadaceae bacterium]
MQRLRFQHLFAMPLLLGLMVAAGCGQGADPDSPFRGSYRSVYQIPALSEAGVFTFTVEQKGAMVGAFQDNNSGKVLNFNGSVSSNGQFSGVTIDGAQRFETRGTLSLDSRSTQGGDFRQTRNSAEFNGNFTITDNIPEQPASSYQGAYSGGYSVPGLNQNGVASFSVNARGEINGQLRRGDDTGSLIGSVANSGSFTATARIGNDTATLSGTLNRTTDGSTSGNFTYVANGNSFPGQFIKQETSEAAESPYQGAYRGTYALPEGPTFDTETGNISFTVDPRGAITGFFSQSANQPVGTLTGIIRNDGTFVGTVEYPATSNRTTRPITGKLGTSSLNGNLAGDFVMTIDGANRPGNFELVGGPEADSIYRGSYGHPNISNGVSIFGRTGSVTLDNLITAPDADSLITDNAGNPQAVGRINILSMTIDKQGNMVGNLGGVRIDARVTNDGRFFGTWGGFPIQGNMSRQEIRVLESFDVVEIRDGAGDITGYRIRYTYGEEAGIAGDFYVTVNGQQYTGSIAGIGGNAEGAEPR